MLSWIVTSCVLILAVILIRRVFRGKASARAIYALWLFVAIRLLVPGSIAVDAPVPAVAEVVNRAPVVQLSDRLDGADSLTLTPDGEVEAYYPASDASEGKTEVMAESAGEREFSLMSALMALKKLAMPVLLCGAVAVALVFALTWVKFALAVRRERELIVLSGVPVRVYISGAVDTPCLFGLISPAIYVPPEVVSDDKLLRHALAHELSHYAQRDHVWCVLRCACLALHWYNPLVWLAVKLSRRDCELSCDEATIRRLGEGERADYGRSLIKLTCESPRGSAVATTMCAGAKELKDRIKMLTKRKHSIIALSLAALLAFTATACSFVSGNSETRTGTLTPVRDETENVIGWDFTSPENAEAIVFTLYRRTDGEWVCEDISHCASDESGRLVLNVDLSALTMTYGVEVEQDGNPSYLVDSYPFSGGIDPECGWSYASEANEVGASLNAEIPLGIIQPAYTNPHSSYSPSVMRDESIDFSEGSLAFAVTFTDDQPQYVSIEQEAGTPYGECVYDFTIPESVDSMRVRVHTLRNGKWVEIDSVDYETDYNHGQLSINVDMDNHIAHISADCGENQAAGHDVDYQLPGLAVAARIGGDFSAGSEIPLVYLYSGSSFTQNDAFYDASVLGADDGYICITATFIGSSGQSDGHIAKSEQDSGNSTTVFDYTAPTGARGMRLAVYRYDHDTGAWDSRMVSDRACETDEGKLVFTFDRSERAFGFGVEYLDGTGSSVDGLSLDELVMTNEQNVEDWGKSVPIGSDGVAVGLNTEQPVVFYIGVVGDTATCSMDYFEHPENIEGDDEYICVTVTFIGSAGRQDGHVAHDDLLSSGNSERFDYTAPTGADALRVRVYSFTDGAWKSRFDANRPLDRRNGSITLATDLTARTLEIITEYASTSSEGIDLDNLAVNAQNITNWGYTVSLTSERDIGLYTEVPLMILTGMVGDTSYTGTDYFEHPELIEGDDEYICVTIMFTDTDASTSEPDPITPPTAQSAELVGFESSYDSGDGYEDIASAWVHDYAENLVIGLPESDPASCSGVSIEGYSVAAASLAQPERIVLLTTLNCEPRSQEAFNKFFGDVMYATPTAENDGENGNILLSRYLVLELNNGVARCVSASTDMPEMWGYLSALPVDSFERFLTVTDSSGDWAKTAVACTNYGELGELTDESYVALLDALESVAIDENGDGDQLIRDLYAMHAAVNSDGAYGEWLGEILADQREHDEASFTLALESFGPDEQRAILTLATPLT